MNKYEEVAKYMYDNQLTYKEMAKYFNKNYTYIYNCIEHTGEEWKLKIKDILKKKKINNCIEMAKNMYDNKLTYEEMSKIYEISIYSVHYKIKLAGQNWKNKIDGMLKEKELIQSLDENNIINKKNINLERVRYMLDNKLTYEEMAQHFNVSVIAIYFNVKVAGKDWETKVNIMLKEKKSENNKNKYIEVVQYMYDNQLSYEETAEFFNISQETLKKYIKSLDKEWYSKINDMLLKRNQNEGNNLKYIEIAQYMLDNKLTYEETAEHFNINSKNIRRYISYAGKDLNGKIKQMLNEKHLYTKNLINNNLLNCQGGI